MAVSFDPEVIYKNAFYAFKRDNCLLFKHDIVKLCNTLIEEISKIPGQNTEYKYVYLDFNKHSLESFFRNYFGTFNLIGEFIYISKEITEEEIKEVNDPYAECVQKAINATRQIFHDSSISKRVAGTKQKA